MITQHEVDKAFERLQKSSTSLHQTVAMEEVLRVQTQLMLEMRNLLAGMLASCKRIEEQER